MASQNFPFPAKKEFQKKYIENYFYNKRLILLGKTIKLAPANFGIWFETNRYLYRADQKNLSTFEFAAIFLPLFLSSNDRKQKSVVDKDKKEENPKK